MKFPQSLVLIAVSLSSCLLIAEESSNRMPVWDFAAKAPVYGFEKWSNLGAVGTKSEAGWTVDGPAAGGFGIFFNDLLDLENASKFHVRVIANGSNPGERLMLKFHAADSKQAVWYVNLGDLAPGEETDVELDLSKPDETLQPEPMDLGVIRQIQVQGSFNPQARIKLTFVRFEAELKP